MASLDQNSANPLSGYPASPPLVLPLALGSPVHEEAITLFQQSRKAPGSSADRAYSHISIAMGDFSLRDFPRAIEAARVVLEVSGAPENIRRNAQAVLEASEKRLQRARDAGHP